ncbi:hypothetical protein LXL04_038774 [Taraxacum kok-saghyz]
MRVSVLEEIHPYLVGQQPAGGEIELVTIEEPIVKVWLTGPVASVMTEKKLTKKAINASMKLQVSFSKKSKLGYVVEFYNIWNTQFQRKQQSDGQPEKQ